MGCKLVMRINRGYVEVRFPSEGSDSDLRLGFADDAKDILPSDVINYGSIFHEFEASGKMTGRAFIHNYYDLAKVRGESEGADYVVVQRDLDERIIRSGEKMRLSSSLTLLLRNSA